MCFMVNILASLFAFLSFWEITTRTPLYAILCHHKLKFRSYIFPKFIAINILASALSWDTYMSDFEGRKSIEINITPSPETGGMWALLIDKAEVLPVALMMSPKNYHFNATSSTGHWQCLQEFQQYLNFLQESSSFA